MLAQVAEGYQAVLDKVEEKLQGIGLQATTRVKTTGTLVDKLRRQPQLPMKTIHDVAGARIVIDGGRWEQDHEAARIMDCFAACPKAPELIDRREQPSAGYRAVHVIVFEDGLPVEIQIRTKLQDTWAQITEKLGDAWGRGLRYGVGPDEPDTTVELSESDSESETVTRREVIEMMAHLADLIDMIESAEYRIAKLAAPLAGHRSSVQALMDRLLAAIAKLGGAR